MWTANIDERFKENGKLIVRVSFANDKETDNAEYRLGGLTADADLKSAIQGKLDELNALDTMLTKISVGPFVSVQVDAIPE